MRIFKLGLLLGLFAVPTLAQTADVKMTVEAVYGENRASIVITRSGNICTQSSTWSKGRRERALTLPECLKIFSEFEKLPVANAVPDFCYRARIDIEVSSGAVKKQKSSCYGVETETSARYELFSKLLF
jgi:hypothetical protein